ncbi:MAG: glycosyltransferase [Actinomycetota bacterium]|nr:glycosyltransferase [Actinomycetota bacterium]
MAQVPATPRSALGRRRARTDPRPHVLSLIDGPSGGAESFARFITVHLDPARYRRTLCVTRTVADPADEAQVTIELADAGATLLMLGRRHRAEVAPWSKLVRYMRAENVDILHAHKHGSNVWASVLRDAGRATVAIAHEHTWSYEGQPLRRLLDRRLISKRCDRIIAVSELDRRRMIEVEHVDPARIVIVPVGIPTLRLTGHDVRAELQIPPEAPVVVSVGHLRPQKAFEVLLTACAELRIGRPSLRVLIVGDGVERSRLEALIESLGLRDTVLLLGRRRDVMDVLVGCDVAVCCSDFEGSPQAVIEYMAAGKPVVATRVGGLPDLVEDGVTGTLVQPRAPSQLARAIGDLLARPSRAAEMGARGQERQRSDLTIDATLRRLDGLYRELLDERGWQVKS